MRGLSVCLALLAAPVAAQEFVLEQFQVESFEVIQDQAAARRATLLADLASDEAFDRKLALAEIEGGLTGDTAVLAGLIDMLEETARAGAEPDAELLRAVSAMRPEAWTMDTLQRATQLLDTLWTGGAETVGSPNAAMLAALSASIQSIRGYETLYGEIQSWTREAETRTDLDIFVCVAAQADESTVRAARALAEALTRDDFGRIRLLRSTEKAEASLDLPAGRTSVIYDEGHGEAKLIGALEQAIASRGLPPAAPKPNTARPSYWYLSVWVCP